MRKENRERLTADDVLLAAHPGSGASWIGTLLLNLGVFYASGQNEILRDDAAQSGGGWAEGEVSLLPGLAPGNSPPLDSQRKAVPIPDQQKHLPVLYERDRLRTEYRERCRVIKTNQSAIGWNPPNRVLLLVRDGRDALLSLYHHLVSFSALDVALPEYLTGNGGAWLPPPTSWAFACTSWVGAIPPERLHILKFETCRERPLAEFRGMLRFLGVEREDSEIESAIEASSYDSMRRAEAAAIERSRGTIGEGRFMRRGQIGEWREVYSPEMLSAFRGLPRRALEHFGYSTEGVPD